MWSMCISFPDEAYAPILTLEYFIIHTAVILISNVPEGLPR